MKIVRLIFICLLAIGNITGGKTQTNYNIATTTYQVDAFGSAATGSNTPFWISSNRYGIVPLESGNGYLRPNITHSQSFGKGFYWSAGIDAIITTPRYKNVYIQQLYAQLGYKSIQLTVGSKEQYHSLWDKSLSSGDMIYSINSRPIPEINLEIPDFLVVPFTKGWFQLKGHVSIGRSFDSSYLEHFANTEQEYIKNVLWHNKSFLLQIKDTRNHFPFSISGGMRHIAQWGGTSTDPKLGKQPQSFKDLVKIFFMKSGGETASESAQVNALGAHHLSYDFQIGFTKEKWAIQAYYQHICADRSGVRFDNKTDGLWGMQLDLPAFPWINKIVLEYMNTKDQSGPFHYIHFDHDKHSGRGGGGDNYYNNGEYTTGNSYFNQAIGSPLLPSPIYNTDGSLGFSNTRIKDWHIGLEGNLSQQLSYRTLVTVMNGWGIPYKPFLQRKYGTSFLVEMKYTHPQLQGWLFTGALAGDTGNILGKKSYGFSLGISKQGILKIWN